MDIDRNSEGELITEVISNNYELLNANFAEMPGLANGRKFPRDWAKPTNQDDLQFSTNIVDYYQGDEPLQSQYPDPWKFESGKPSPFLADKNDLNDSLSLGFQWLKILKIPVTTLITIRSILNMIIDSIEITGYKTPIGLTKILADFIVKNFPIAVPTPSGSTLPDFNEITYDLGNLIEVYNSQFKTGLKTRKNFMAFNQYYTRRTNYENWTKFSSLMDTLAADIGPFSHCLINTVVEKIDNMLAHELLNSPSYYRDINEYDTNARTWVQYLFRVPRIMKIISGKQTIIKKGISLPIHKILQKIMPLIVERESLEGTYDENDSEQSELMSNSINMSNCSDMSSVFSNQ